MSPFNILFLFGILFSPCQAAYFLSSDNFPTLTPGGPSVTEDWGPDISNLATISYLAGGNMVEIQTTTITYSGNEVGGGTKGNPDYVPDGGITYLYPRGQSRSGTFELVFDTPISSTDNFFLLLTDVDANEQVTLSAEDNAGNALDISSWVSTKYKGRASRNNSSYTLAGDNLSAVVSGAGANLSDHLTEINFGTTSVKKLTLAYDNTNGSSYFQIVSVPEPSCLFLVGVTLLCLTKQRKRSNPQHF